MPDKATSASVPLTPRPPRVTLRLARGAMSFIQPDESSAHGYHYEPYVPQGGISSAANLREAFKSSPLLKKNEGGRALVVVDSPVMVVPVEEFDEKAVTALYRQTFTADEPTRVMWTVLPSLSAVAVFTVNKDVKLLADDHFSDVRWSHVCVPVWNHLHRTSNLIRRRLFVWFHERHIDVFSFQQTRFRFVNSFEAAHVADAVYFILAVWKQLAFDQKADELHLLGDIPDRENLREELHAYVRNVFMLNPSAEFNRAPVTQVEGLPYDLITLYMK